MTVLDIFGIKPLKECCWVIRIYCWRCFFNIEIRQQNPPAKIIQKKTSATFPVVMIVLNKNCGPLRFFHTQIFTSLGHCGLINVGLYQRLIGGDFFRFSGRKASKLRGRPLKLTVQEFPHRFPESISPTQPEKFELTRTPSSRARWERFPFPVPYRGWQPCKMREPFWRPQNLYPPENRHHVWG